MCANPRPIDAAAISSLLSEKRISVYLDDAGKDPVKALELYQWSARMASDMFELVGHVEVILRNALDRALVESLREDERGIPWFLLSLPGQLEAKLSKEALGLETVDRDTALANLTMGFWQQIVNHREMWKFCSTAFPNEPDPEKVRASVRDVHALRNRLAHHSSMLDIEIPVHIDNALRLVGMISGEAVGWLKGLERASETYKQIPIDIPDTLLVPARQAWPLYYDNNVQAYICQPDRFFKTVKRVAFYCSKKIQVEVPRILERRSSVPWTEDYADQLDGGNELDKTLAMVIRRSMALGWVGDHYQVFLLTPKTASEADGHVRLNTAWRKGALPR